MTLQRYHGSVALLDFWATWCPSCIEDLPTLQRLHTKFRGKNFSVVGVSLDEDGAGVVKPVVAKHRLTYPILLDMKQDFSLHKTYGVESLPARFLLDTEGRVIEQWAGKTDKAEIETAIINAIQRTTRLPRETGR